MTLRVVYHNGTFLPEDKCDLKEGTHGVVLIDNAELQQISDPEERRRLLADVVERLKNNPVLPDSPRLTRDQMHDRD
jgi:predicted DNA-binding antitoxin AbrB/MazE fold protein